MIPNDTIVPFALSHWSGYTTRLMKLLLGLAEQGTEFTKAIAVIQQCRTNRLCDLLKQAQKLNCPLAPEELTGKEIITIIPSRFMLTSIKFFLFLHHFFSNKEDIFSSYMHSLSSGGYITLDHTFKDAANIGYFRSDHKWITQFSFYYIY